MIKNLLSLLFLIGLSSFSFSQSKITIKDAFTSEPMPFVKMIPDAGSPQFTDIDGKVLLPNNVLSFQLRFHGYKDTVILVENIKDQVVFMTVSEQIIQEVKVVAGENPAHRIMDRVIDNRKKNHPLENDAFTYNSYSKFIFDLDSTLQQKVKSGDVPDSTKEIVSFLNSQHLFILESASERTFIPPARDRENITAYKVSGITHPMFATFAQSMQSFNFYDNQFDLLGNSYVNPIAFGGTKRYLFILQDTTVVGNDTTFTISYRPRLGKDFSGLQGQLFINTNGYAIEKVIAEPFKDTSTVFKLKIVQDYNLIEGKKWFPVNLSTYVQLKGLSLIVGDAKGYVEGTGHTYIKNIKINPSDIQKRGFGNISLATDVGADKVKEDEWNGLRKDTLTEKESRTYVVIDSLGKAANLDKKLSALLALSTGKLRMGPVNLLLDRIVDYNIHEGYRLGAGLETSDLVSEKFTVGGYFGYGTRDYQWKYGGYSTFFLNPRRGIELTFRYQEDIVFRGGTSFAKKNGFDVSSSEFFSRIFRSEMEGQRLAEMQFSFSPLGNLTTHLFTNYQRITLNNGYVFSPSGGSLLPNSFELFETSLEVNWNIRERIVLLGNMKVAKKSNFPRLTAKITKGQSTDGRANLNYTRGSFKISEEFKSLRFGAINVSLHLTQTFGSVPLYLKQNAFGSRQDWHISTANTFETVFPAEFYHDRQVAFFVRYDIPAIHTKARWNEPQFIIHHGIGYGDFKNKSEHNVAFSSMDKGLFEGGLILSGILKANFLDLGVGLFYRYGYYSEPQVENNLVPKISLKIAL